MSQTLTSNQVSSPYAMYKPETKQAFLPYEVLRVASQFVSKDESKYLLQGIHLKAVSYTHLTLPTIYSV